MIGRAPITRTGEKTSKLLRIGNDFPVAIARPRIFETNPGYHDKSSENKCVLSPGLSVIGSACSTRRSAYHQYLRIRWIEACGTRHPDLHWRRIRPYDRAGRPR